MKILFKRTILTVIVLVCSYLLYNIGLLYYMFYQEHKSTEIGRKNIEGARIIVERNAKIDEFGDILDQGKKHEDNGRYVLAIEQYKKALATGHDDWMARCGLARVYEKSGQYKLALTEINWIIAQNPRQQVKDEYIVRKQKLEKLIEQSKKENKGQ